MEMFKIERIFLFLGSWFIDWLYFDRRGVGGAPFRCSCHLPCWYSLNPARRLPLRRRDPRCRRGSAAYQIIRNIAGVASPRRGEAACAPARAGLFSRRGEAGKGTARQRWLRSRHIAHPVPDQLLQTPQLGAQIFQFAVAAGFPALECPWNQILQSPDLVGKDSRLGFSSRVGGFEVGDDRFDVLEGGIEFLRSFGFGRLQCRGVCGELIDESKGTSK